MTVKYKMILETINKDNTTDKEIICEFNINGYIPTKANIEDYFYELAKEHNITLKNRKVDNYFTSMYLPKNIRNRIFDNTAVIYTTLPESTNKSIWLYVNETINTRL